MYICIYVCIYIMHVCMYIWMYICMYAGSKIFRHVMGLPMGLDPATFFANLFLIFYESRWLQSIKNTNHGVAGKFGNIFRFIDDLIAINDGNEFENHYNELYPPELISK